MILLDTDTFFLLLRGTALVHPRTTREKNVAASARRIRERCREENRGARRVGLSAISLAELEYGLHAGGRYEEKLLSSTVHFSFHDQSLDLASALFLPGFP